MQKNILKVKMLGGFSLHYGDKEIVLDRSAVSKTLQLLQMILLHTREGIAKSVLIDALYGRDEVENKNGSLNNTIFRLRKLLKAAGIPGKSYIVINAGICRWEESVQVETDCCRFAALIQEAQEEAQRDKRMQLYAGACSMYAGEFLPDMIGEEWAAVKNVQYKSLYDTAVEELCNWLKEQDRFEEIYRLATKAAEIYPFDDWQMWVIDSLISMSRYREAMDVYEKTSKLFFDELGIQPSPEMLDRFHFMAKRIQQSSETIEDIKKRLWEREHTQGAYYTTLPSFIDICHVICRMMERNGTSVFLMLCALKNEKGQIYGEDSKDREVSEIFREAVRISLRRGDFYTKYNLGQYLVMLFGIDQENCAKVSGRIDSNFRKKMKKSGYKVDYYVASAAEISPDFSGEKRTFTSRSLWET